MDDSDVQFYKRVIDFLIQMKQVPALYTGSLKPEAFRTFLSGLYMGFSLSGKRFDNIKGLDFHKSVITERGWQITAEGLPVYQMHKKGMTEQAILDEGFDIEIAIWTKVLEHIQSGGKLENKESQG